MNPVLLIDFGSTNTKVTAVCLDEEKILGTAKGFTTVSTDINEGLDVALKMLFDKTGYLDFSEKFACSSAAGGLKMIAIGLVPELTAEAARRAALNAGAKVLKVYTYELTRHDFEEISNIKPDIVLLTGGTDGGNKNVILHNAKVLSEINLNFPIIIAGNKSVAYDVQDIFRAANKDARICENVMPEFNQLNIEPAKNMIREIFLERIVKAKGLTKAQELIAGIMMPTPSAVLKAAELLSKGTANEKGLGELLMVDVGGATTDIYSIASGAPTKVVVSLKGLPEPYAKRTVEGDLGVRYSSAYLVQEAGIDQVATKSGLSEERINAFLNEIEKNPGVLPDSPDFEIFDNTLSYFAVKIASDRHSGKIENHFTTNGMVLAQTGKDLTNVTKVVGTGGPILNAKNPKNILEGCLYDTKKEEILKPAKSDFYVDKNYILAAMGLLSEKYPDIALRIMKSNLTTY